MDTNIIKMRTVYGDYVYINKQELDSGKTLIKMYTNKGILKTGERSRIHRENLVYGDVKLPDEAVFEDEMKASKQWVFAKMPKTAKQQSKLFAQGFLPYLRGDNGLPQASPLGIVYAKPKQGAN
ncbi:MAG: hypothetical protein K0U21_03515 [Proteobacteria bacterium]|nr:hypothetical protein [Pseudomonadota bacterium]